jgi:hypothetical protein
VWSNPELLSNIENGDPCLPFYQAAQWSKFFALFFSISATPEIVYGDKVLR